MRPWTVARGRRPRRVPNSARRQGAATGAMTSQDEPGTRRCFTNTERYETVVVGGGQTGLTVAYHLARRDQSFVILDANERIGDSWRQRWDSLRLFTPACYDGLPGCRSCSGAYRATCGTIVTGAPTIPRCFPPCAYGEFADRPQGPVEGTVPRWTAHPRQAPRPFRRRHRTRAPGRRRRGRAADAARPPSPESLQRHLVHGFPSGLLLDRSPRFR